MAALLETYLPLTLEPYFSAVSEFLLVVSEYLLVTCWLVVGLPFVVFFEDCVEKDCGTEREDDEIDEVEVDGDVTVEVVGATVCNSEIKQNNSKHHIYLL